MALLEFRAEEDHDASTRPRVRCLVHVPVRNLVIHSYAIRRADQDLRACVQHILPPACWMVRAIEARYRGYEVDNGNLPAQIRLSRAVAEPLTPTRWYTT